MKYKDFYKYLLPEGYTANSLEYEYDEYIQENPKTDPVSDMIAVLDNLKIKYKEVEIPYMKNKYIVTDTVVIEIEEGTSNFPMSFYNKNDFLYRNDFTELESFVEETFNDEFWSAPSSLYHATQDEFVEEIKRTGLKPSSGTGISNRWTRGVFTVSNPELLADGHYGNNIFEIDTKAMKKDGLNPLVQMEPLVLEGMVLSQVAHAIGYDRYDQNNSDGQWEETVIVDGRIDPKYLKLLDK
jgi:hypothetical protein